MSSGELGSKDNASRTLSDGRKPYPFHCSIFSTSSLVSFTEIFATVLILAVEFSPHLVEAQNVAEEGVKRSDDATG